MSNVKVTGQMTAPTHGRVGSQNRPRVTRQYEGFLTDQFSVT